MSRNQFSDMMPRKRSIRDIPLPHKQAEQAPMPQRERINVSEEYFDKNEVKPLRGGKGGNKKWWIIAILLIAGGFWGASVFLHAATVNISPERAEYRGVIDISARTDASPAELQYDSLQFVESASKKVPATSEEDVSVKASGKIIIYNTYSSAPQKLVANTRFESASGKIYRITDAVTIPGYKTEGGQKIPGSVEATIFADAGGEAYNSAKTDFTIPGFKGSAQYQGFYGRSTTDIAGGFVGKQKKVDPAVLAEATDALKAEISSKISQSILGKIPADFIFLTGAQTIEYTVKPIASEGDQGVVTVEGNVHAYVFKKAGIDEALRLAVANISAPRVMAHDYSKLSVDKIVEDAEKKTLQASLSGEAVLYAVIEKDTLAKELAGVKKSLIGTVMNTHAEIIESQIYVRPPWMISLPKNPERIHIIEQIDE